MLTHTERFKPGFINEALEHLQATLTAMTTADRIAPVISAAGPVTVTPVHPTAAERDRRRRHGPVLPASPLEEAIAAVYRDILGVAEIDVTASFFELGGDSFDAVRAISRIDGASVGKLAAHPSVRQLASALDPRRARSRIPACRTRVWTTRSPSSSSSWPRCGPRRPSWPIPTA